jgi:hypothetical protein
MHYKFQLHVPGQDQVLLVQRDALPPQWQFPALAMGGKIPCSLSENQAAQVIPSGFNDRKSVWRVYSIK